MKTAAFGLLGTTLDAGSSYRRWDRWRPTVGMFMHEDLLIDRMELLASNKHSRLASTIADDISMVSPDTEVRIQEMDFADPWDFQEVYSTLADYFKTYPFDQDGEEYLVHITTGTHVAQICMFLLAESRQVPAKLLQTSPDKRSDEPAGTYSIIDLDLSKYDRLATRFAREAGDDISYLKSGIETRNEAFNRLIERIEKVAVKSREPILLQGPTGAGKSSLARRIFELKKAKRKLGGPFVEVNCATLRGDAAMSALFGHRKGAFTGAVADREGLLKAADGGMLFLDEVGELGLDEQAMLLRAIEEGVFLPMGSDKEASSSFQLICGSNKDLLSEAAGGRFRHDLLARINLWVFHLPGLADRREDIEPNVRYELDQYAARTGMKVSFNREGWEKFMSFALSPEAVWSANFRDLSGAVTRMGALAPQGRITPGVVKEEVERLKASWRPPMEDSLMDVGRLLGVRAEDLDLFDKIQLAQVVGATRGCNSISDAGRKLFGVSRGRKRSVNDADRLAKYLSRFGLAWDDIRTR